MFDVTDPRFDPNSPNAAQPPGEAPPPRRGRGCLFWGCLITGLLLLLIVVGVPLAAYFALRHYTGEFTAPAPAPMGVVELAPERLQELQGRLEAFGAALDKGEAPADLELTAEEVNGLIHENKDLRGKAFVRIADGVVGGELSIPADAVPGGAGRYFNASVDFEVSMQDGQLSVFLTDAKVNGAALPGVVVDALSRENLAKSVRDNPKAAEFLDRFETLEVVGDRILLRAKRTDGAGAAEPAADAPAEIETFDEAAEPALAQ